MKSTVLIIEEAGAANDLRALLEGAGYGCHHARGPLKVRSLLEKEPIDLIVWREQGANEHLIRDLAGEWSGHPEIPVVHLYFGTRAAHHSEPVAGVAEAIPAESASTTLLPLLSQILHGADAGDPSTSPGHTELAFRNVVSRMRAHAKSGERPAAEPSPTRGPSTALKAVERKFLFAPRGPNPYPTGFFAVLRAPFRKLIARWCPPRA